MKEPAFFNRPEPPLRGPEVFSQPEKLSVWDKMRGKLGRFIHGPPFPYPNNSPQTLDIEGPRRSAFLDSLSQGTEYYGEKLVSATTNLLADEQTKLLIAEAKSLRGNSPEVIKDARIVFPLEVHGRDTIYNIVFNFLDPGQRAPHLDITEERFNNMRRQILFLSRILILSEDYGNSDNQEIINSCLNLHVFYAATSDEIKLNKIKLLKIADDANHSMKSGVWGKVNPLIKQHFLDLSKRIINDNS